MIIITDEEGKQITDYRDNDLKIAMDDIHNNHAEVISTKPDYKNKNLNIMIRLNGGVMS